MAWASMLMPDCCRTCALVNLIISCAMSASRTRDSAACMFSAIRPRRAMVCSSRFWVAPRLARLVVTVEMAASIEAIAADADAAVETAMPLIPRSFVEIVPMVKAIV